jgi:translation elongation factor EF-Tu-like GTPase
MSDETPWAQILVVGEYGHGKSSTVAAIAAAVGQKDALYRDRTAQIIWTDGGLNWDVSTSYGHGGSVEDNLCRLARQLAGLIIVVDATTGPSASTRAEAVLAKGLGAPQPIVFLNKVDVASSEQVNNAEREARDFLQMAGWSYDASIVRGSATEAWVGNETPLGLPAIRILLSEVTGSAKQSLQVRQEGPFWMPCRAFGDGKTVSGLIHRGTVCVGDEIERFMLGNASTHIVQSINRILQPGKTARVSQANARDIVEISYSDAPAEKIDWQLPITLCARGSLKLVAGFSAEIHFLNDGQGHVREYPRRLDQMAISSSEGDFRVATNFRGDPRELRPGVVRLDAELPFPGPLHVGSTFRVCTFPNLFHGTAGFGVITCLHA